MRGCGAFGSLFFWLTTGVEGFEFESFEVVGCSSSRVLRCFEVLGLWSLKRKQHFAKMRNGEGSLGQASSLTKGFLDLQLAFQLALNP